MMTLFQLEGCPECAAVRQRLSDAEATYLSVCVPRDRQRRAALVAASGQASVPTLIDGDVVLTDVETIVQHLNRGAAGA